MDTREPRYQSKGKVFIAEISNADAVIKNLSSSGLCIQGQGFIDIMPKNRYSVNIIPEEESNIDPFSIEVESRWVKAKMKTSESGFVIVIPAGVPKQQFLEDYINYLASQPDSEVDKN